MFDLVDGLPVHALVVHAVVVLLPLACLGTIAIALVPRWRARFGVLVVAFAAVATALVPVATSSGEALEKHVGDPGEHAELGDQMIWFAVPLLVLALALVVLDRVHQRRQARTTDTPAVTASTPAADGSTATMTRTSSTSTTSSTTRRKSSALVNVVAVLALLAALAATVQVYRVGESGARAVWGDQVGSSSS